MKLSKIIASILTILILVSCQKEETITASPDKGNDPNFSIVTNIDEGFTSFTKKIIVFGIPIYAVKAVEDAKLLHAANLMAQYLDNDEDGTIDNQQVVDAMITNKAYMVMWKSESDLNIDPPSDRIGQDLGNDETYPSFVANGKTGNYDAALEEVLHIITHAGYAKAYPSIFGEQSGTTLTNAMDIARGGHYETIPASYPANAWYHYNDSTCEYGCMATEYIYWALTSILGAQENRLADIEQEWKLNTKDKIQQTDIAIYQLLTDPQYNLPTVLPDGTYKR